MYSVGEVVVVLLMDLLILPTFTRDVMGRSLSFGDGVLNHRIHCSVCLPSNCGDSRHFCPTLCLLRKCASSRAT